MTRLLQRTALVVQHAFSSLLPPVFNVAVSLLVVRLHSPQLWGAVVDVVVIAQLVAHVIAWGNKEHLLRAFSTEGADVGRDWSSSLWTRVVVLAPLSLGVAVVYGSMSQGWGASIAWPLLAWVAGQVVLQSLDVVVLFHKRFVRQVVVESCGAAATVGALWFWPDSLSVTDIVGLLAAVAVCKAAALRWWLRDLLQTRSGRFDGAILRTSAPFFLLGVSGMLGSRADLYCVAALLSDLEVARYQVLMNMLLYLQAMSNLALLPFAREVYGMELPDIRRLSLRFGGLGVVVSGVGICAVWAMMRFAYQLPVGMELLLCGFGYAAQMYFALPLIYGLYKCDGETLVLRVNVAVVTLNIVGNLALIPVWGIRGALLSSFLTQLGAAVVYFFTVSRLARRGAIVTL